MATDFKTFLRDIAPPWLLDKWGDAWLRAFSDVKDSLLERTKDAVRARFPLLGPEDALALTGAERQLPRAPSELTATYRQRVVGAWDAWPWAGTAKGVLNALRDSGYPGTQVLIAKGKKYSLNLTTQALVITDLLPGIVDAYWSSFWVFFPASSFPARWSGTPPLQSSDEGQFIINQVRKWKSAHARFDRVVFDMGGPIWGLSTWGSFTWGGAAPVVWEGPWL